MKRIAFTLALLAIMLPLVAQPRPTVAAGQRPTVAVVLSGGGAKGVAHIAALRAIEEAGIPIDIVCGTSMGSLIGALYCIGYSTDFLDSLVRAQDWVTLLSDRSLPTELTLHQRQELNTYVVIRSLSNERPDRGGLIRGRNLDRLFRQLCHAYPDSISFDSLPIRYACVATDIVTNNEVDFHSGHLTTAMRASMAIPGVFTPVRLGDSVLVDGGLRNNYPADIARSMGADIIIGVTVQNEMLKADEIHTAADVLNQIIDHDTHHKYTSNLAISNLVMKVDVSGYGAGSFTASAIDTLLRRGAEEAARHRDDLLAISAQIRGATHSMPTTDTTPTPALAYQPSSVLQPVHTTPAPANSPDQLTPTGRIATKPIASVGFRFDSEDLGTLLLNLKTPLRLPLPAGAEATLRFGQRLEIGGQLIFLPRSFTSPTLAYNYRHQTLDIYTHASRTYNIKYHQHTADFAPLNFRFRNYTIAAGLRWDYFNYSGGLLASAPLAYSLDDDHYFTYHLRADLNTEDQWYFPTTGTRIHIAAAYHTNNLVARRDEPGLPDLDFHLRLNLSPLPRLTLQPMFYGRLLPADHIPLAYSNTAGGYWFGHFTEHQMPLAGVSNPELVASRFAALQLQAQIRILNNHYILLAASTALQAEHITHLLDHQPLLGLQLGYSYLTPLGPIDLRLGNNTLTFSPTLFLNLGHQF